MHSMHIGRLERRYRLPLSAGDARKRLDRIFGVVLDGRLEAALDRTGISPHEEICLRSASSLFRPRLSLTDESIATQWSLLLAEAIQRAASGDPEPGVVRYTSRVHAMVDMAGGVLRGDYGRTWAWRQLGFWRRGERPSEREAVDELTRALMSEPQAVVAVLAAIVRLRLSGALCTRLETDEWVALAVAASRAAGAPAPLGDDRGSRSARTAEPDPDAGELFPPRGSVLAALASRIAGDALPALAVLVLLETDPALARLDRALLNALLARIERELRQLRTFSTNEREREIEQAVEAGSAEPEFTQPALLRIQARTSYGGLLFLLGVVADLDLASGMAEAVYPRSLSWGLHLLALTLVDAEPGDPAVLAFAGLPPNAKPPSSSEAPPSDEELQTIHSWAAAILAEAQRRLEHLDLSPELLLRFISRRAAWIAADPGWIEVHFSLDDVSTDLRRAALDLDPGYLPWLGVVVRFVYE
ncbi:MAG: hypothetical protein IH602_19715 [Bryobacteraceae bacterium]|nr:hypothetical protein [Bryobacteraceae bacterium]